MHFSKTYTQLLLSLPPELRENAIQYRQLKKLINQIVDELSSLGLSPDVLQDLVGPHVDSNSITDKGKGKEAGEESMHDHTVEGIPRGPRAVYEFNSNSNRIEPRLRLWVNFPERSSSTSGVEEVEHASTIPEDNPTDGEESKKVALRGPMELHLKKSLIWALQEGHTETITPLEGGSASQDPHATHAADSVVIQPISQTQREIVIPLISDSEFFQVLSSTLESVSDHLAKVLADFEQTLKSLAQTISDTARPYSSTSHIKPLSGLSSNAGSITVHSGGMGKSDLYSWREIFQLYAEMEIFESISEASRGERTVEESEERLKLFAGQVTQRGLSDQRKLKQQQSRDALEVFLKLNLFILNVKKFSRANAEATRKILKKHAKRTALPFPSTLTSSTSGITSEQLSLIIPSMNTTSLPRVFVQAIGVILTPIIPHVDDYACLICTSIAFKPIRLNCGHLFCVRCLVKMQKRGNGNCPMCRAPSVLVANRSNVDWALLNFMQDWFPLESREKLKQNEKEANDEEMRELGLNPDRPCLIM